MKLVLGIDTGGTYTDTVLLDLDSGQVRGKAKALTTPHDLSIGIAASLAGLDKLDGQRVKAGPGWPIGSTGPMLCEHRRRYPRRERASHF